MQLYFNAEEIITDPENQSGLPAFVRLPVTSIKEAVKLTLEYEKFFPAARSRIDLMIHDPVTYGPPVRHDLRRIVDNAPFLVEP